MQALERKAFAKTLQGSRIILQMADVALADLLWKSILRDRQHREVSWPGIDRFEDIRDYLSQVGTELPSDEVVYLITLQGLVIGSLHLHTLSYENRRAELGYAIEKNHEGHGYVSEAVPLLEAEAKKLGFHRLEIHCNTDNLRSIKLAERNHFVREGTLLQHSVERGKYRDTAIFGKIL